MKELLFFGNIEAKLYFQHFKKSFLRETNLNQTRKQELIPLKRQKPSLQKMRAKRQKCLRNLKLRKTGSPLEPGEGIEELSLTLPGVLTVSILSHVAQTQLFASGM